MSNIDPGRRLRVAVVGLRMGAAILDALSKHPRADVRAICDPIEERASMLAEQYAVPTVYAAYEEMLASEELDGVCISTPNRLHTPMVRAALDRGLHVLCEKPLTLDTAEAYALLQQARLAGITHGVNYSNRSNPAVRYVKEQLDAGVCGDLREVHLTYLQDWLSDASAEYTWRNSRAESGSGVLGDLGSHLLDLGRYLAGEISMVSASLGIVTPERTRADGTVGIVDADDLAHLHLRYASGAFGLLRASRVARGRCDIRRIELFGERASLVLEIDAGVNRVLRADGMTAWRGDGFREVFAYDPALPTWGGNTIAWVDAALQGLPMSPNFEDGLRSQEIMDAAIRSDEQRCWVDVEIAGPSR